ncbi:MAG: cytochrome c [Planctomycetota bacterium]|nr:cytochrome c [Planctomycetota bacterium]
MALPTRDTEVPGWIIATIIVVNLVLLVPPMLVAKSRYATSRSTRVHVFYDMDQQQKFKEQGSNDLFADGRAMRLPVPGTVARGELNADEHYHWGTVDGEWAKDFPPQIKVNAELLDRGAERFSVYCTPCHGLSGHGDGMVPRRTAVSEYGAWIVSDLSSEKGLAHPIGEIFNIIGYGINTMPGYRTQIPPADRWALVAHVKSIQFSQSVDIAEIPEQERKRLEAIPLPPAEDSEAAPDDGTGTDSRQGR